MGDVAFELRCLERMRDLQRSGTTIVFVSHHMHAVHLLCPRTVVVHRGRVDFDGPTDTAIARFHQLLAGADDEDTVNVLAEASSSVAADDTFSMISPTAPSKALASSRISALRCCSWRCSTCNCSARIRSVSIMLLLNTCTASAISPTSSLRPRLGMTTAKSPPASPVMARTMASSAFDIDRPISHDIPLTRMTANPSAASIHALIESSVAVSAALLPVATSAHLRLGGVDRWLPFGYAVLVAAAGLWTAYQRAGRTPDGIPFAAVAAAEAAGLVALLALFYPQIVPPSVTLYSSAASRETIDFLVIAIGLLLPLTIAYHAYANWVFRGRQPLDDAVVLRGPASARGVIRSVAPGRPAVPPQLPRPQPSEGRH